MSTAAERLQTGIPFCQYSRVLQPLRQLVFRIHSTGDGKTHKGQKGKGMKRKTSVRAVLTLTLAVSILLSSLGTVLALPAEEQRAPGSGQTAAEEARAGGASVIQVRDCVYRITVPLNGVQRVQIPTWSNADGQDDIIWYEAHRDGNGGWTAEINTSFHGGGEMTSHIYADGNAAGGLSYTAPAVPRAAWDVDLSWGPTRYAIVINNLRGAQRVQLPTWGVRNGQNDLVWYKANNNGNGNWSLVIESRVHDMGSILTHIYVDGQPVGQLSVARNFPVINDITYYGRPVSSYVNIPLTQLRRLLGSNGEQWTDVYYMCSWEPLGLDAYCNAAFTRVTAVDLDINKVMFDGAPIAKTASGIRQLLGTPNKAEWVAMPHVYGGIYTYSYTIDGFKLDFMFEDGPNSRIEAIEVYS